MRVIVILMMMLVTHLSYAQGHRVQAHRTSVPVSVVQEWTGSPVLTAHVMLEGGESGGYINGWNYNSMGIKATGNAPYMLLMTTECFKRECKRVHQRFRSFPNLGAALHYYLNMMEQNFPESLEAAKNDNIHEFALALKREGYYTKSVTSYEAGLKRKRSKLK